MIKVKLRGGPNNDTIIHFPDHIIVGGLIYLNGTLYIKISNIEDGHQIFKHESVVSHDKSSEVGVFIPNRTREWDGW